MQLWSGRAELRAPSAAATAGCGHSMAAAPSDHVPVQGWDRGSGSRPPRSVGLPTALSTGCF